MKLVFQQKLNRKLVDALPPISSSEHDPCTRPRCYSARISVSITESLNNPQRRKLWKNL
jgi:hypothetical protein